jgi:hypothetical protein
MAKNKSKTPGGAEDYLTQVEWQNQQSQRQPYTPLPWYMEPKSRFKRVASLKRITGKSISPPVMVLLVMICVGIGYFLYKTNLGFLLVLLFIGSFIFLAIRDASKKTKDDN